MILVIPEEGNPVCDVCAKGLPQIALIKLTVTGAQVTRKH
jgi:hypothetical protein